MSIDHRNPHLRRGFAFIALMAVLGLSALGLTQCRLVEDRVTGIDLNSQSTLSARSGCVRLCNERFKNAMKAEEDRHRIALRACRNDNSCKRAENRTHQDNLSAIIGAKKSCKRNCYNEGAGNAGR
jgi:Tfp pilus assembly protein PilX